jgi:hypothetical protein
MAKFFLENRMDYVGYAKQIATYVLNAENEVKEKIRQKFKQRTIEDVSVLHTMLGKEQNTKKIFLVDDFCGSNLDCDQSTPILKKRNRKFK